MSSTTVEELTVGLAEDGDAPIQVRLWAILDDLPAIAKDSRNTQQNFNYRSHDDVMNALTPLLAKHGVFIVPDVIERTTAQRTTRNNSIMYEVNLHVRYRFYGLKGDYVEASTWGEGTDSGDKSTNKAMTMAFKNAIAQVFAISTDVTIDTDGTHPEETYAAGQAPGAPGGTRTPAGGGQRVFDVAKDLMPGAIRVRDEATMNELRSAAAFLDPTIEPRVWLAIEEEARGSLFGDQPDGPTPAQWGEHWIRFANFVAATQKKAAELGVDFPERTLIAEMLSRAYEGFSTPLLGEAGETPPEPPANDPGANESLPEGNPPQTEHRDPTA